MDERYRVLKNSVEVSELKGLAFEEYLTQLFHDLGYKTKKTVASGDFGADVLLRDGDKQIVVQAKQYASNVGFEAVKEAYFALGYYAADEAWVVTTSSFTQQAIDAAKKTGVKLISGSELDVLIARAHTEASGSSFSKHTANMPEPKASEPDGIEAAARRAAGCTVEDAPFVIFGEKSAAPCRVLTSYVGNSSIVETPMSIDAIGENSFSNCGLRKIVIHEGIKYIGDGAFSNCKNLETVQLPSTLVSIGNAAFSDCDRLESIQLPTSLISIGDRAFYSCSNLKDVALAENLRSIGDSAFESNGIITLSTPKCLETIGARAFAGSALITADLDSSIDVIPEEAFSSCTQLNHITLPHGVKRIGASAFSFAAITAIDFPSSLEDICHRAFSACRLLRFASLPAGIKNVCRSAFSACNNLEAPDLDDAFYEPVIVRDEAIPTRMAAVRPSPDVEQLVSKRDSLFYTDRDFTIGDFVIAANDEGLASYALCDDAEFEKGHRSPEVITRTSPIKVTLHAGTYLYLSHATAIRLEGSPSYITDVQKSYENAVHMYESERFEECKNLVSHALVVIEQNDEAYRKFREQELDRSLRLSWDFMEDTEILLSPDFGLKSGLNILLLSKLQILDDCMTCRTWESYYDPKVSLFKTVRRILFSQIDRSQTNVQAEFCEFAFRLVYENSMFAHWRAEEEIRELQSKNDEREAEFRRKMLDESKEDFKETLSLIVQRVVDLSKSPDFDIRFLSFVYRILSSKEREVLDKEVASTLDGYLVTILQNRCQDEYQERLRQFENEHSRQINVLDYRRREMQSSHDGLSFFSPAKVKQRKAALKELDDEKAVLESEMHHAERIVAGLLWKSFECQRLDRLL